MRTKLSIIVTLGIVMLSSFTLFTGCAAPQYFHTTSYCSKENAECDQFYHLYNGGQYSQIDEELVDAAIGEKQTIVLAKNEKDLIFFLERKRQEHLAQIRRQQALNEVNNSLDAYSKQLKAQEQENYERQQRVLQNMKPICMRKSCRSGDTACEIRAANEYDHCMRR